MKTNKLYTSINEFKKSINENSKFLTGEMKAAVKEISDIFGIGDFDEDDEEITQEDFYDVIDDSDTIEELITNLDSEFDLDSRDEIMDILKDM